MSIHHSTRGKPPRRSRAPRRATAPAAVGTALALLLAACGGGGGGGGEQSDADFNEGETTVVNPSDQTGGTLRYAVSSDFDSPDPGNTYYAYSWNFSRYYARTLLTYVGAPGEEGVELQPDLAEEMPESNDDATEWTVKLKKGLKYEDGSEIVAEDVKYAIARSNFGSQALPNGPKYFQELLADSEEYEGPYAEDDEPLAGFDGIETPDDHTLVFHLNTSFSEFPYVLIQPQTAPVPAEVDRGEQYQTRVLSSGPYKFDGDYRPGVSLNLERNEEWDASTDPTRKALPDRIEVQLGVDQNEIDQRLVNGELDVDLGGAGVGPAMKGTLITDEAQRHNVDNPQTNTLRYVNVNTVIEPLDDKACREAILFAADRDALQRAWGGDTGGDVASQIMPSALPGADPEMDLYPSPEGKGDLDKAREKLEECGHPDGFSTAIGARADRPSDVGTAEALQQALARVGIETEIKQYPSDSYTNTQAGSPDFVHDNDLGLTVYGWAPDWASGYGFMSKILDGDAIQQAGNVNVSEIDDEQINTWFDEVVAITDADERADIYSRIDERAMEEAAILPAVFERTVLYRPTSLTNVYYHAGYSMYDYMSLGTTRN
ncbi:ABC transporter substrate-binding protein [Nocardiopsis alba]|uniref:ABC transporter substrate-binding protein n=1 Tax=Nocardiopsis alba TaxID=53437 RepID=A0A7K2ILK6_9ACTN|nr:ABC transporter substrate-binding protein [Nocardiopsis sp. LDBS1602]MEC3895672.1 ABC transporter substrate-binding protein [Nocardiopsis sp. LDBS1602]MYR30833.1 ABC transporter substrate-binding protein [Nocardiopsis alba]